MNDSLKKKKTKNNSSNCNVCSAVVEMDHLLDDFILPCPALMESGNNDVFNPRLPKDKSRLLLLF
jgi:hypothetical protein